MLYISLGWNEVHWSGIEFRVGDLDVNPTVHVHLTSLSHFSHLYKEANNTSLTGLL